MLSMLDIENHPGRLFVLATILPLIPVLLLAVSGTIRNLARRSKAEHGWASWCYWLLGGDQPLKAGGYLAVLAMIGSMVCSIIGTQLYLRDHSAESEITHKTSQNLRWQERFDWIRIGEGRQTVTGHLLEVGYRIDHLSALMITMVAIIGSMIFLFSLGYMHSETQPYLPIDEGHHSDHHQSHDHNRRRGRFGRFYLYLCLFAFSMFNLLIADNLFQVFVSWELVGVCSFFLIGFYYEKKSAGHAANKAFIMNRIGDAGFLVAIAVAFASFGTLNFQDLFTIFESGKPAALSDELWFTLGLGLFIGCMGKSAQVPLQTWLPDAMEGPTPVSALIHAATMVAAGVYLVGRSYPLFSPDVMLVIAYTGLVTLFLSATVALVMTDIKRILAFSTCSQLGFMMLSLGIGAWTAALLHLLTHAFFKALLFLGAGSVIHGSHHEQDIRRMGGLRRKMPVTAITMLIGVLAISGAPLFSGWYSKDQIISGALGFSLAERSHALLFFVPLITAGLTAFYMFRLWFLTFAGQPRDTHLHDHAHESPVVMTLPLIVLSLFSIGVAWGWPIWDAEASLLGKTLHHGEPTIHWSSAKMAHKLAEENHLLAGGLALAFAIAGTLAAWNFYGRYVLASSRLAEPRSFWKILAERWYFDAIYDAVFVRSALRGSATLAALDKHQETSHSRSVTLDGILSGIGVSALRIGEQLRAIQTGSIRGYVLILMTVLVCVLGAIMIGKR